VVVVDDNSDNDEWVALNREDFPWLTILSNSSGKKGPSVCRNIGWKKITSNWVVFLDSDDVLHPCFFQQRLSKMHSSAVSEIWVFPGEVLKEPQGQLIPFSPNIEERTGLLKCFLQEDPPFHLTSVLWSKAALKNVGGFDENLTCMEDPDIHIRALLNSSINVRVATGDHIQPDFQYRVGHKNVEKHEYFVRNSIFGRFPYYRKLLQYKNEITDELLSGYQTFFLQFLAGRANQYPEAVTQYFDLYKKGFGKDVFFYFSLLFTQLRKRNVPLVGIVFKICKLSSQSILK